VQLLTRKHWVFDLDGTLTQPIHDFALIRSRLEIDPAEDILDHLAALPEQQRKEKLHQLDELERFYTDQTQPAHFVHEVIELLWQRGCRLGILTRNRQDLAQVSLEIIGIGHCFEPTAILGRDEAMPKPDPAGLNHLFELWQCSAADAVMVGDYRYDMEAGRAAGAATVHVSGQASGVWPEITDLDVTSLEQLFELLNRS